MTPNIDVSIDNKDDKVKQFLRNDNEREETSCSDGTTVSDDHNFTTINMENKQNKTSKNGCFNR